MRYAVGAAFSVGDIYKWMPLNKLHMTCIDSKNYIGDIHRNKVGVSLFCECFKMIVEDVLNNDVRFKLPLAGNREAYIQVRRYTDEDFKQGRRNGKWQEIDFLASNFTGYTLTLKMCSRIYTERYKEIYIDGENRKILIDNTNAGKQYYSKVDSNINKYVHLLYLRHPELNIRDIDRFLKYGWRIYHQYINLGGDILIKNSGVFWAYTGRLMVDSLKYYKYYCNKLSVRIMTFYKRKKIKWDGYYYFMLTQPQYDNYLSQKKAKGRPRKWFKYGNIILYKVLDVCLLANTSKKYLFKIPYPFPVGDYVYKPNFECNNAEFVKEMPIRKFKDILKSNKYYELLK